VFAAVGMGVVESLVAVEISPIWSSFSFFVVLIAFLLVRPQGIFGVRERVL
jgi:branched-chain amino acid transport system permease protein